MSTVVRTQAGLDAALAALGGEYDVIEIRSPQGVWLTLLDSRNARVVARGSSSVVARGSSSVVARGSSSVEAWGSSSVEAWDSSSVEARDSSSVVAWGSSSVVAMPHVAIHLHSPQATVRGGVVIDVTAVNKTAAAWIEHHGIETNNGEAVVYKAVSDDWTTPRGYAYKPGAILTAPDWRDTDECGYGLHFSPHPRMARDYHQDATRYVAVAVNAAALRPIGGSGTPKCKAQTCRVLHEVDINGKRIEATS